MSALTRRISRLVVLLVVSGIAVACGGGSSTSAPPAPPPPPPPPPPMQTSFDQFVQDQFAVTADDTDPQSVDGEDFAFQEDPTAFDGLLQ